MGLSPLKQSAKNEDLSEAEIEDFLKPFGVDLRSEGRVGHHRLRLTRVYFAGTKKAADEEGDFSFEHSFLPTCTSVASDRNLTGKTSVVAIVKWALRGEADDDVPNTVRQWMRKVEVEGTVDKLPFAVEFDSQAHVGQLVIGERSAAAIERFSNRSEFVETMETFFADRLELPEIPSFVDNKPGGTEVAHGWRAYLGAIWVSDANEDLLLGETAFASLPARLLNMFVAVPFAEASYSLGQSVRSTEARATLLAFDPGAEARATRAEQIEVELESLRDRVDTAVDPVSSSQAVKTATSQWRKSDQDLNVVIRKLAVVAEDHNDAAGELRQLKRDAAAGRILSGLEPSRCPRCASEVHPSAEADEGRCYVCTSDESAPSDDPADDPTGPLEDDVRRLAETMAALRTEATALETKRDGDAVSLEIAQDELQALSDDGLSDLVAIARLEGELSSINQPAGDNAETGRIREQLRRLKAIRKIVEAERKGQAEERFAEIDLVLLQLLKRLGFQDAARAHLLPNGGLEITYVGGAMSVFKTLSDGEKARARLATVIAMLSVGGGRHPGLIVYDSLKDNEMNDADFRELLGALREVSREHDVQIIVTNTAHGIAVDVLGEPSVIGPSSNAGHIF